jgi:hypothetical protein
MLDHLVLESGLVTAHAKGRKTELQIFNRCTALFQFHSEEYRLKIFQHRVMTGENAFNRVSVTGE